jgi:hypothetical protein
VLNEGGLIVIHDVNPRQEYQQVFPYVYRENVDDPVVYSAWTGDIWKVAIALRLQVLD